MDSTIAFKINQQKYGKGVFNIEFDDTEVRDYLSRVYPRGIDGKPDLEYIELYGLATSFAKKLQEYRNFVLTKSLYEVRYVFCGHISGLLTIRAKIVIDSSTVRFLAGGMSSFRTLMEGFPVAAARGNRLYDEKGIFYEVYFCQKLTSFL